MNKPQSTETEDLEDSSKPIPPIVLVIPPHIQKNSIQSIESSLQQINPKMSRSVNASQEKLPGNVLRPRRSREFSIKSTKYNATYKKARQNSVNFSKSFMEDRNKVKEKVKCDLKKGSFSDKQKVVVDNNMCAVRTGDRKSTSPFKRISKIKLANISKEKKSLKAPHKENIEDRKKTWRMAMREPPKNY